MPLAAHVRPGVTYNINGPFWDAVLPTDALGWLKGRGFSEDDVQEAAVTVDGVYLCDMLVVPLFTRLVAEAVVNGWRERN